MSTNEVETKARAMGWRPKEQFRGAEKNWVDAETYVQRADQVMPILKENNARLESDLNSTRTELSEIKGLLKESQEAIKELAKFNSEVMRDKAKAKREEIVDALKEAKKEGNVDAEVTLTEQLATHSAAIAEAERKPAAAETKPPPAELPEVTRAKAEFSQWAKDNPWYNVDSVKTGLANGIAAKLREDKSPLIGKAFYDEVAAQVETFLGGNSKRQQPDKTEGGGRGQGAGGGGSGGDPKVKTYSDLPADAQAACEKFTKTLVGPNKSYKTVEDWRKAYAADYFSRE